MTPSAAPQHTTDANSSPPVTHYRTATVDDLDIFYREAGPANGPAIVLLHGFPTSSHMFRNLIPLLADRYHVIAPDYPGFGLSAAPDHAAFDYGFGRYADLMDDLLQKLGVQHYAMYVMDYGAAVSVVVRCWSLFGRLTASYFGVRLAWTSGSIGRNSRSGCSGAR